MANESQTFQYGQAMLKNPDTYTKISNAAKFMKTLREELDHTVEIGLEGIQLDSDWRERNAMFRWQLEGIQGAVTDAKWRFMVRAAVLGCLEDVSRSQHNGHWRLARYSVDIVDSPADHLVIPESGNMEHASYRRGTREEIIVRAVVVDVSGADDLRYIDGAPAKSQSDTNKGSGAGDIASALRDAIVSLTNPEAAAPSTEPVTSGVSALEALAEEHGLAPNQLTTLLDSLKSQKRNDNDDVEAEPGAEAEAPASAADDDLKKYTCGLCQRKFKTPQGMRFHMKKHTSVGELTTEDAAELAEAWIQVVKNGS
jgi:hypothetical protein